MMPTRSAGRIESLIDPKRDVEFVRGPGRRISDPHASQYFTFGSKMGIDGTRKWPRGRLHAREWPERIEMDDATKRRVDCYLAETGHSIRWTARKGRRFAARRFFPGTRPSSSCPTPCLPSPSRCSASSRRRVWRMLTLAYRAARRACSSRAARFAAMAASTAIADRGIRWSRSRGRRIARFREERFPLPLPRLRSHFRLSSSSLLPDCSTCSA